MPRPDRRTDARDDTPIRRRTRKAGFWTPATISAVAGCGLAVVALVVFLATRGGKGSEATGGGPNPGVYGRVPVVLPPLGGGFGEDAGETWSHKELTAFLNEKGLQVEQKTLAAGGILAPSVKFTSTRYPDLPTSAPQGGFDSAAFRHNFGVICQLEPSSQKAKDVAGAKGDTAFSWGRFVFDGGPQGLREDIRKALGVR